MSVKDITFVWSLNYNNGRETCVWVKKKTPFALLGFLQKRERVNMVSLKQIWYHVLGSAYGMV